MSNVSDILTQLSTQVSSVLGGGWTELPYSYDPEKNGKSSLEQGYGVGVEDGATVSGATQFRTYDHSFFVILTKRYINRSSDENQRTVISSLHDAMDTVDQQVFQRKLGIPNVVLNVSDITHDGPERLDDHAIMLKATFTVKHRS